MSAPCWVVRRIGRATRSNFGSEWAIPGVSTQPGCPERRRAAPAPTARRARPASASCARTRSCRCTRRPVLEVVDAQLLRVHPARGDPDHALPAAGAASAGAGRARGWRARARGPRRSRSALAASRPRCGSARGRARRYAYSRTAASELTSSVSTSRRRRSAGALPAHAASAPSRRAPTRPSTIARPRPALAPVTSTTLPSSRGGGAHAARAREVADVAVAEQRAVENGVQHARHHEAMDADVIVVGGGLAGLVATAELAEAGKRVILRRAGAGGLARRAGVLVPRRALHGR